MRSRPQKGNGKRNGRRGRKRPRQSYFAWSFAGIFLLVVAGAGLLGYVPWPVPVVYVVLSAVAAAVYIRDKANAQAGMWRTPESSLHLLELLGGWPGALITQWTIFHKNRKASYQGVFWVIVLLHLVVLGYYFRLDLKTTNYYETFVNRGKSKVTVEMPD